MDSMLSRGTLLAGLGAAALPLRARVGPVEIGMCGAIDDFEKAEQYGFDYQEPGVAAVAALSEAAFADFPRRVAKSRRCGGCSDSPRSASSTAMTIVPTGRKL